MAEPWAEYDRTRLLALCKSRGIRMPRSASVATLLQLLRQHEQDTQLLVKWQEAAEALGMPRWREDTTTPRAMTLVYDHVYSLLLDNGFAPRPGIGQGKLFIYVTKYAVITGRAGPRQVSIMAGKRADKLSLSSDVDILVIASALLGDVGDACKDLL